MSCIKVEASAVAEVTTALVAAATSAAPTVALVAAAL